jgi:lon-related putative ATP-dependent protease
MIKPLEPDALYKRCDAKQFKFQTTAELEESPGIIGQDRAVDAVKFGIGIRRKGYNLYALGLPGTGKQSVIREFLEQRAADQDTPPDWIYVNNFDHPVKPKAIKLPAGKGCEVERAVERLVEELHSAIPAAFESENYRNRRQAIEDEFKKREEKASNEIQKKAEAERIAFIRTPNGVAFAPTKKDGEVMSPEEFKELPEREQEQINKKVSKLQEQVEEIVSKVPKWEKQYREKLKELTREVTALAVGHLIDELREELKEPPELIEHLDAIEKDVIENVDDFLKSAEESKETMISFPAPRGPKRSLLSRRYLVNALIDHSAAKGAPVVYEDNPTYHNLIGQTEYTAHLGALVTDFNLIKPGALHRANGGYLMLDALKVLAEPYAWEGLKRVLRSSEIRIEPLAHMLGMLTTVSLEPQPIPLDVKIVLLGDHLLYYALCALDPDFNELFKVPADFDDQMDRTSANSLAYASLVGALAKKEELLPFNREAVSRVIEQSARMAGDAEKLSTRMGRVVDLLREADYWAHESGRKAVSAEDVQQAIDEQIHRADRVREREYDAIRRGFTLIDTTGEKVGQVNGLSVIALGAFMFGRPTRITARVGLGEGKVVDIEREVELGGPIHSKGVFIISGYLRSQYVSDRPLSLSASLVFEQSYGAVEGDSASAAETFALLSALADAPIKQSLAVTGSVNQEGQIQAIGGVNEKIEGFFDVCKATELTGEQGVLIPASNVKNLMLRRDVVEAVAAGKFQIYPIETIDEGIEAMTGIEAGERDSSGHFPKGSINRRVEERLIELAEKRKEFGLSTRLEK